MAIVTCPSCSHDVPDGATTCPDCGAPVQAGSRVVVYGNTQRFALNPTVSVFWDGKEVGQVGKGEQLEFEIDHDGQVDFKWRFRSASTSVRAGQVNKVSIVWDRLTGKMVPQAVDTATP